MASIFDKYQPVKKSVFDNYQPQEAPPESTNPFGAAGDAINNFGKAAGDFGINAGKTILDSTVVPLAKGIAQIPGAGIASLKGGLAGLDKPWFTDEAKQAGEAAMQEPIDVPGLGNINPFRANDQGGVDPLKTMGNIGAQGIDSSVAALNMFNPTAGVGKNIVRGGLQGAAQEAENPESNPMSVAVSGAVSGLTSGLFTKGFNSVSKWLGGKTPLAQMEKEAAAAGIKPDVAHRIAQMKPEDKALQKNFLDMAFENIKKPDEAPAPMEHLANGMTNDMKILYQKMQDVGKKIGGVKQGVREAAPEKINMREIKDNFLQSLDDLRIKLSPITEGKGGTLDFGKSKIKRLTGDQEMLTNAWSEIKNAKSLDDLMVARDTLRTELHFGRMNQKVSAADAVMKKLDGALTDAVHKARPDLAEFDSVFSGLRRATEAFQKKTGGNVAFNVEDAMDGTNTFNLLRKSLGSGNNESKKLLEGLQTLGKKYNLPTLANIMNLRRFAQTAEDIAGTDVLARPTSFTGRVVQGGKAALKTVKGDLMGAAGDAKAAVSKQPMQADVLKKLMESSKQAQKETWTRAAQKHAAKGLGNIVKAAVSHNVLSPNIGKFMGSLFH